MDTLSAIKELAAKQFGGDAGAVDADASFQALGADSLGMLEFMFELEDHFEISISQDDAAKLQNLRELAALIDRHLAASATPSE
ncbi:MAG: acyl carrier protein [Gemmatimonadaceae bacterium]